MIELVNAEVITPIWKKVRIFFGAYPVASEQFIYIKQSFLNFKFFYNQLLVWSILTQGLYSAF